MLREIRSHKLCISVKKKKKKKKGIVETARVLENSVVSKSLQPYEL